MKIESIKGGNKKGIKKGSTKPKGLVEVVLELVSYTEVPSVD